MYTLCKLAHYPFGKRYINIHENVMQLTSVILWHTYLSGVPTLSDMCSKVHNAYLIPILRVYHPFLTSILTIYMCFDSYTIIT